MNGPIDLQRKSLKLLKLYEALKTAAHAEVRLRHGVLGEKVGEKVGKNSETEYFTVTLGGAFTSNKNAEAASGKQSPDIRLHTGSTIKPRKVNRMVKSLWRFNLRNPEPETEATSHVAATDLSFNIGPASLRDASRRRHLSEIGGMRRVSLRSSG